MKSTINDWKQLFQNCVINPPLPISLPTVALANPPYCKINPASDLELARFEMAYKWQEQENGSYVITSKLKTQVEQECLFVEQCLNQVQPGEIVCVLVSNGILSSSNQAYFRRWLLEDMALLIASVQLPSENFQVECGLGIVTSFLILKRKGGDLPVPKDYSIFMAVADKIGFDSRGRLFHRITKGQETQEIDSDLPVILEELKKFLKEVWQNNVDK
ncbi:N-6 DNA methylase [Cylindrospermum stagnale]|uniref:N-6 DNA methylase n=1 Tax=Cylindrospermum stagnale TaxID=142864 RepID=UPI0002E4515D|nr:N-6 DNA methylase [Cylindrospermum stagnale]